ncbi:hypothetical protein D1872_350460 [compost metagenome]
MFKRIHILVSEQIELLLDVTNVLYQINLVFHAIIAAVAVHVVLALFLRII